MLESFFNNLFLKFWSGKKKVGPKKRVLLSKSFVVYGDTVIDLRWSLKYIHDDGKTSHAVTLTERANKWNLQEIIEKIEETKLPKEIDSIISKYSATDENSQ